MLKKREKKLLTENFILLKKKIKILTKIKFSVHCLFSSLKQTQFQFKKNMNIAGYTRGFFLKNKIVKIVLVREIAYN